MERENKQILFVHLVYALYGGVAMVAASLIKRQIEDGYGVAVAYVIDSDALEKRVGQKVEKYKVNISNKLGRSILFGMNIEKVYQYFTEKYPDRSVIIHAHNAQTIGLFAKVKKIPLVYTIHGTHGPEKTLRHCISDFITRRIIRKLYKNKKPVVALSNYAANFFDTKNRYGIKTIHNGTDTVVEDEMQHIHKGFVVGHIGDISRTKGVDMLLNAFKLLKNECDIKLLLAGKSVDITEKDIGVFLSKNDLKEKVEYLGFIHNPKQNVFPYINVIVLMSVYEGLSLALIEAMSCGIPAICSAVGGIPEVVKDGYNGFLVANEKELAQKILLLKNNKNLYAGMSANALKVFNDEFTFDKMYEKYMIEYKKQLVLLG